MTAVNDQLNWVQRISSRFVVLAEQRASARQPERRRQVDQLNAKTNPGPLLPCIPLPAGTLDEQERDDGGEDQ